MMLRFLLPFLIFFTFISCKRNDENPIPVETNKYLVSQEKITEFSMEQIALLANLTGLSDMVQYLKNGVVVYRVEYKTTYQGGDITASGLICIPKEPSGSYPLLSVQHGTTFRHDDAPSVYLSPSGFELFTAAGYVTLVPDYIGYGSSKDILHPYYNYEHTSGSVIDLIRAAKEFVKDENVTINDKLFLAGYSEGGYATLATQKAIEGDNNLGLSITASAAGAGGYNLNSILNYFLTIDEYPDPSYLALILSAFNEVNDWDRPISDFFQEPYASKIPGLIDGTRSGRSINEELTTYIDSLLNPVFVQKLANDEEAEFILALHENSVNDWKPVSPTRLFHGTEDTVVPSFDTESTYNGMIANGSVSVELFLVDSGTHSTAYQPMILNVLPWFESLR